jgi:hypothetical protein
VLARGATSPDHSCFPHNRPPLPPIPRKKRVSPCGTGL